MRWLGVAALLASIVTVVSAQAANQHRYGIPGQSAPEQRTGGPRSRHWSGFDVAAGMPFPSTVGVMIGFNFSDAARVSGGAGTFGTWLTYNLDGKFFLGESPWAGYFGGGLSYLNGGEDGDKVMAWQLDFDQALIPYIEFGVDYQAENGFHFLINLAGAAPGGEIIVMPGLALGWYF